MNKLLSHVPNVTSVVFAKGNDSKPSWPRRTQRGRSEKLTSGATTASHGYVSSKITVTAKILCSSVNIFNNHHPLFHVQQTTAARKPAPAKNDSFFGAFQGLSLDGLMGGSNGSPAMSAPAAGAGDQCKVM